MSVVQIRLPEDVGKAIEREVAAGRASSAQDYVAHALPGELVDDGAELVSFEPAA